MFRKNSQLAQDKAMVESKELHPYKRWTGKPGSFKILDLYIYWPIQTSPKPENDLESRTNLYEKFRLHGDNPAYPL